MNPGSRIAKENGCTCDSATNNYGRGHIVKGSNEPLFIKDPNCIIHGVEKFVQEEIHGKERHAG